MAILVFFQKLFGKSGGGVGTKNGNGKHDNTGTKLMCVECKQAFLFKTGEQEFFKMRGLTPPKRCPGCRSKRKRRR